MQDFTRLTDCTENKCKQDVDIMIEPRMERSPPKGKDDIFPATSEAIQVSEPIISSGTEGKRRRKLPAHFRDKEFMHDKRIPLPRHCVDNLPEPLPPVPPEDPPQRHLPRVILIVRDTIRTAMNNFGLMREYPHRPSYDLDAEVHTAELATRKLVEEESAGTAPQIPSAFAPPWPHTSMTHWHFMSWLTNGNHSKSQGEATKLVNLMKRDDFDPTEITTLNVQREFQRIDKIASD